MCTVLARVTLFALMLPLLAGLLAAPSHATDIWRVVSSTGDVRVADVAVGGWRALVQGDRLPAGSDIETGKDGRLILGRNDERLWLSPNGRISIDPEFGVRPVPRRYILHMRGNISFSRPMAPSSPLRLRTPYLIVAIDGGVGFLSVDWQGTALHLEEGSALAISVQQRVETEISAGQIAIMASRPGGRLMVVDTASGTQRIIGAGLDASVDQLAVVGEAMAEYVLPASGWTLAD